MQSNNTRLFKGFSEETARFFLELQINNTKAWFDEHREIYNEHIIEPMKLLVTDMSDFMLSIDPLIETRPAVGKTIARINRDIRFSKDKSPYKDHLWISFKRPLKEAHNVPDFFFEIGPFSYRYGMGFYAADKSIMDNFRHFIDVKPDKFKEAISFYGKQDIFTLEGDMYKRIIDKTKSPEILNWYQRKNLYLICTKKIDSHFFDSCLVDDLQSGYSVIKGLYQYLYKVINGDITNL